MLLKTRQLTFAGMMSALAIICIWLGNVMEHATLCCLAAGAFLIGLVARVSKIRIGIGAMLVSSVLSFILTPQKLYVFTFLGFSIYIIVVEFIAQKRRNGEVVSSIKEWLIKGISFHLLMFMAVGLYYGLMQVNVFQLIPGLKQWNQTWMVVIILILVMEAIWFIFDRIYAWFQIRFGTYIIDLLNRNH